ncbi:AAA family ATPase [Patescibacteria group bacterium]
MRIAVVGTQRSGKTTLVKCFEECLCTHIVQEAATDLIEKHGSEIVYDPRFQDLLFEEQTRREREANRLLGDGKIKVWLCDRTIIDNLAYIRYLRKTYSGDQDPESVYPIRDKWLTYIRENPFDLILLCDPSDISFVQGMNVAWESDELDDELRIRTDIHELYLEVLTELGVNYEIISGTVEERATYVEGVLQERGITITKEGTLCQPEGEM